MNETDLIELFCEINFLRKENYYTPIFEQINIPRFKLEVIFESLSCLGLVSYDKSLNRLMISELFENFLDSKKSIPNLFKTFIIVENDFKLYAYSNLDYLKFLLSLFTKVEIIFPNLIICSITEEKIKSAHAKGISAV